MNQRKLLQLHQFSMLIFKRTITRHILLYSFGGTCQTIPTNFHAANLPIENNRSEKLNSANSAVHANLVYIQGKQAVCVTFIGYAVFG